MSGNEKQVMGSNAHKEKHLLLNYSELEKFLLLPVKF